MIETRNNPDYWKTAGEEVISRAMKDLKTLTSIETVYTEVENLVKLNGEPEEADQTGYDLASLKALLLDLRIDCKNAKNAVIKEDSDRALFSLETSKGEA